MERLDCQRLGDEFEQPVDQETGASGDGQKDSGAAELSVPGDAHKKPENGKPGCKTGYVRDDRFHNGL